MLLKTENLKTETENLAKKLSASRKKLAVTSFGLIQEKLVKLEMPRVKFEIKLENSKNLS